MALTTIKMKNDKDLLIELISIRNQCVPNTICWFSFTEGIRELKQKIQTEEARNFMENRKIPTAIEFITKD